MRELGRVVVLVCDGDGGRRRPGQAHFASRHVLGHDLQLVSGGRQRLEDIKTGTMGQRETNADKNVEFGFSRSRGGLFEKDLEKKSWRQCVRRR